MSECPDSEDMTPQSESFYGITDRGNYAADDSKASEFKTWYKRNFVSGGVEFQAADMNALARECHTPRSNGGFEILNHSSRQCQVQSQAFGRLQKQLFKLWKHITMCR